MTPATDATPTKKRGRPPGQHGITCPRCGRLSSSLHAPVCIRVPLPAELAAEYRANSDTALATLAQKYDASSHFIAGHLLHGGVTRREIDTRHAYVRRTRMLQSWREREVGDLPPGVRACGRCAILIYTSNPPYPYQRNVGGLCEACVWEMEVVNKVKEAYNLSYI